MAPKPKYSTEKLILETWRRLCPAEAFAAGLIDCAGRLFIPIRSNVDEARKRITAAITTCEDDSQRKLLNSLDTYLIIAEPQSVPDSILQAIFMHMILEEIKPAHMVSLAEYGRKAIQGYLKDNKAADWSRP
jgi:hypothetical protein